MTVITKELLASFFSQLKGALVAYLYMSKNNRECEGQIGQLVQVLREMKYLRQATEDPNSFVRMNRRTMTDAIYYTWQHNTDICDIIIETGHLLNIIGHSGSEPDLDEWLERVQGGARGQPSAGVLISLKDQILITFDQQMHMIRPKISSMMASVSTYKTPLSLFAAVSMTCLGVYGVNALVNMRSPRSDFVKNCTEAVPSLASVQKMTIKVLSNKTKEVVDGAIDVGGLMLAA